MERNIYLDNVKGLLIFFVVLGHVVQKYIYDSEIVLSIFVLINLFHMPLFVYISGYLSKDVKKVQSKAFVRFLLPYIVWNSVYYILISLQYRHLTFSFLSPGSMLWYFLSLFTMCIFLPVLIKIRYNVLLVFLFSLIIGFFGEFGHFCSFSRTICFFGFFLLGYYSNQNYLDKIKALKWLWLWLIIILSVFLFIYLSTTSSITDIFNSITRRMSYRENSNVWTGLSYRAIMIPCAILFSCFILSISVNKKTLLTQIGQNSIIIFIFQGYFLILTDHFININPNSITGIIILIVLSVGITFFLALNIFHEIYNKIMRYILKLIKNKN
jgi:fucose 4-O-acetylase-like acetyltransferase